MGRIEVLGYIGCNDQTHCPYAGSCQLILSDITIHTIHVPVGIGQDEYKELMLQAQSTGDQWSSQPIDPCTEKIKDPDDPSVLRTRAYTLRTRHK